MQKDDIYKNHYKFNCIIKENDELYRYAAKNAGLSDCAFWILYVLRAEDGVFTQRRICSSIYLPKQTINSALKKLENDGYITLTEMKDRRSKQVCLTENGCAFAKIAVDPVIAAEQNALAGLSAEEQEYFIQLFRQYTDLLRKNITENLYSPYQTTSAHPQEITL